MRKYSKWPLAIGAALLMLVSGIAFANARRNGMNNSNRAVQNRAMMIRPGMILRGLNLTPQQKDQVKAILSNHKPDAQTVIRQNAEARKTLGDDIFKGADQATLQADFSKVSSAEWNAVALRSKIWNEIRQQNILTADQMAMAQKRHERMDQHLQNFLNRRSAQSAFKPANGR